MNYGHFTEEGLEYVITNPNTPRPWINYLTNEKYCAIISNSGGGYSFYKDCGANRILRWAPENWHTDRPGRYVYIRDDETEDYWSATWQPVREKPQFYECRHGLGYTKIKTKNKEISSEITYFTPKDDPVEVWKVTIKNEDQKKRKLSLFPFAEWMIGKYLLELQFRNILTLYNRVWFNEKDQAILAKKTAAWAEFKIVPDPYTSFFATSLNVDGYDCNKDRFVGRYNTIENPQVIKEGRCKNTISSGEDSVAVVKHNVELDPNEEITFSVVIGINEDRKKISELIKKYRDLGAVAQEFELVRKKWGSLADKVRVKTPDKDFDNIVNVWVKYQLYIANYWSRSPSYFHEGAGGRGYRDSNQDAEGILAFDVEHAKRKLRTIATLHHNDGQTAPGWSDETGFFEMRPVKDHPTWFPVSLASYVRETGDVDFLNEKAKYTDGSEATIFQHALDNLYFTYGDRALHGMPRIGHADWNDAFDTTGIKDRGSSVWLAMAFHRSLIHTEHLARFIKKDDIADDLRRKAEEMRNIINSEGWDGNWYLRGFNDDDKPFGSKDNEEGKIFLNSQSWAILGEVADEEKQNKCLESMDKYLDGEHAPALFHPAYTKFDPTVGRITMFSPGTKENAAVFCHAVAFKIVADCKVGRGDKAYDSFTKILPNKKDPEVYKTEPYAFAEYLVGPDHPYLYGEGAFTWITGTASWMFIAATEWILGARRTFEGLKVDPCIPSSWDRCKITRPFRGATYEIEIENPNGVQKGVKEMTVDGEKIDGQLIEPHGDGKTHKVKVIMG